ncbi:MAG: nucleotidyltransferase domain-containing protein [Defluviitaleaceae bacterium]|nr:nucleotidyltransferase domain-containing protein [Defluviitaleaceae bacterium]
MQKDTTFKNADWKLLPIRNCTRIVLERVSQKRHNLKVRYVVLFGSEARGEAILTSDVDIAVISDEPLTLSEKQEFAEIFEERHFPDFRVINTLTSDLNTNNFMDVNYHIKKDGLLIYER